MPYHSRPLPALLFDRRTSESIYHREFGSKLLFDDGEMLQQRLKKLHKILFQHLRPKRIDADQMRILVDHLTHVCAKLIISSDLRRHFPALDIEIECFGVRVDPVIYAFRIAHHSNDARFCSLISVSVTDCSASAIFFLTKAISVDERNILTGVFQL